MHLRIALLIFGIVLQAMARLAFKREFPQFWVSRPIWNF